MSTPSNIIRICSYIKNTIERKLSVSDNFLFAQFVRSPDQVKMKNHDSSPSNVWLILVSGSRASRSSSTTSVRLSSAGRLRTNDRMWPGYQDGGAGSTIDAIPCAIAIGNVALFLLLQYYRRTIGEGNKIRRKAVQMLR